MLESSLHFLIMYPLSSTSTCPSIHFSSSTCTLHWGQAPFITLFHTSIYHSSSLSLFDLYIHFCFIHPYSHNPSISLILTCYPYLTFHTPFHVPFIHSCSLSMSTHYSHILPSFFHMTLILVIPSLSSTSYPTLHPYPSSHYPFFIPSIPYPQFIPLSCPCS